MAVKCVDLVKPAFGATRKFLFPIKLKIWLKLGFLALFLGGMGSGNGFDFNGSNATSPEVTTFLSQNIPLIIAIIALFVVIGFVLSFFSSIFTFTFIKSVDTKKVLIGKNTRDTFRKGLSYFGFNLVYGILVLGLLALTSLPLIKRFFNNPESAFPIAEFLLFFVGLGIFVLVSILIMAFVKSLVVYCMYLKNKGFIESVKQSWKLLKKNAKEIIIFVLMKFVLGILGGIGIFLIFLIIMIPLALIVALLAGVAIFMYKSLAILAIIFGVLFAIALLVLIVFVILMLSTPVSTFLVEYNLMFMKKLLRGR